MLRLVAVSAQMFVPLAGLILAIVAMAVADNQWGDDPVEGRPLARRALAVWHRSLIPLIDDQRAAEQASLPVRIFGDPSPRPPLGSH